MIPLSFGIIRDEFPREKVGSAVGVIAALLAIGGGLGLVLAGPIVNVLDYHWLFWIPGVVGMGMFATFAFLPGFLQTPTSSGYGFGASITESGLLVLPMSATMSSAPRRGRCPKSSAPSRSWWPARC